MNNYWERFYNVVNVILQDKFSNTTPTQTQVDEFFDSQFPIFKDILGHNLTEEDLAKAKARASTNRRIMQEEATTLDKEKERKDWVEPKIESGNKKWNAWKAYKDFLERDKKWASSTIQRLDTLSTNILNRLGDPEKNTFDYRGLAVGDIQSGKTTAYCAVISKAYDMGYRNFLVLSGMAEDLRIQCQTRIEEAITGFDTRDHIEISQEEGRGLRTFAVRDYQDPPLTHGEWSTTSKKRGDFTKNVLKNSYMKFTANHDMFKVTVVKKNKTILNNIYDWLIKNDEELGIRSNGDKFLKDRPFLVIDDEADLASINTKEFQDKNGNFDPDLEPSAINKSIRNILSTLNQSSYLGFTATPYANVFINASETASLERDIFPEDFIINVKPPSNYFGATKLLGFDTTEKLPLLRKIDIQKQQEWMPVKHKKEFVPLLSKLPEDLKNAIKCFILGIAVKEIRDKEDHTSMLIHTSRFIDVHNRIHDQISEEINQLNYQIKYGDEETIEKLKKLYEKDFIKTGKKFIELFKSNNNLDVVPIEEYKTPEWNDVKSKLKKILDRLSKESSIVVLNSNTNEIIDFNLPQFNQPGEYLYRIFIGGQRLSRGLTIEGLTVSYFTRVAATPLYDSLMQMARWFGYRTGYLDLCRIYSTEGIFNLFESITEATEDMKNQFDIMARERKTPREFSIAVQNSPGLNICARSKMRTAIVRGYDMRPWNTCQSYLIDDESMKNDKQELEKLISKMNEQTTISEENSNLIWEGVQRKTIIDFFNNLSDGKGRVSPTVSANWIDDQESDKLNEWTVILKQGNAQSFHKIEGLKKEIKLVLRTKIRWEHRKSDILYKTMSTGGDYELDLNDVEKEKFEHHKNILGKKSGPHAAMKARPSNKGILIIYPVKLEGEELPLIGWAFGRPEFNSRSIEVTENSTISPNEQLSFEMEEVDV